MSMFKNLIAKQQSNTVGNESAGALPADNNDVNILVANARVGESMAAIAEGAREGDAIQIEIDMLDEGLARIESGLNAISQVSIGAGVPPALSSESLGIITDTLLTDVGVVSTGNESQSVLGPLEATEEIVLGLESIAGDAWASMRKAFYKFLDWITAQFNKLFGGVEGLKAKAEAIKKKEDSLEGNLSKDTITVDVARLATGADATAVESSSNIASGIGDFSGLIGNSLTKIEDDAVAAVDEVSEQLNKSADDWADTADNNPVGAIAAKFKEVYGSMGTLAGLINGGKILGSRTIVVAAAADVGAESDSTGGDDSGNDSNTANKGPTLAAVPAKLKLTLSSPTKSLESKDIKPLDRGDIPTICDNVIEVCDELLAGRKKIVNSKAFKSKFEKITKGADKLVKDKDYSESTANIRVAGKVANTCGLIANGSIRNSLMTHVMTVMGTALSYADKSLKLDK